MTDALYIAACLAFFAVMLGFVFLYDQWVGGADFDTPGMSVEANEQDEHGSSFGLTGGSRSTAR